MNTCLGLILGFIISQTLNERKVTLVIGVAIQNLVLVGRVLVSRTDNVGKTVSLQRKVPNMDSSRD